MMRRGETSRYGMKAIVERFGDPRTKAQYKDSAHGALFDAETLAKISTTSTLGERFKNWLVFNNDCGALMRQRTTIDASRLN